MSEEDLVRQQEELFKASRARFEAAQQAAAVVAASANTTSSATGAMLPLVAPLQASSSSTSVAPDALVAPMFPTVAADVDLEEGDDNVDDVDALQRALDDDL